MDTFRNSWQVKSNMFWGVILTINLFSWIKLCEIFVLHRSVHTTRSHTHVELIGRFFNKQSSESDTKLTKVVLRSSTTTLPPPCFVPFDLLREFHRQKPY